MLARQPAEFANDSSMPTPLARVIEVGEVTAGIAVPERGGVRFFSSERSFDRLDGTFYRSVEQAARAARGQVTAARS